MSRFWLVFSRDRLRALWLSISDFVQRFCAQRSDPGVEIYFQTTAHEVFNSEVREDFSRTAREVFSSTRVVRISQGRLMRFCISKSRVKNICCTSVISFFSVHIIPS